MRTRPFRRQSGLTLIELLIAVAIVGIITTIAYPNYATYLTKTKRSQATACLQEAAQYMERFYTTNLRYDQTSGGVAVSLPNTACVQDMSANYTLAINSVSANAYALKVTPRGAQATADTQCGTLTLAQNGTRTISGSGSIASCW